MTKSKTPEELRAEVVEVREQLALTVEKLAAKADVKGRAQMKATEARGRVRRRTTRVAHRVQEHAPGRRNGSDGHAPRHIRARSGPAAASAGGAVLLTVLAVHWHRHHAGRH